MANFMPALERRKSVHKRKRKTYLQNNRDITAFRYHRGFSFTFEHLEHSKNFRRFYSGSVELFLIPNCCNSATTKPDSSHISKQNRKIISQMVVFFKDEFRSVSSRTRSDSSCSSHKLNSVFGLDKHNLQRYHVHTN